jgi:hypothetical protein
MPLHSCENLSIMSRENARKLAGEKSWIFLILQDAGGLEKKIFCVATILRHFRYYSREVIYTAFIVQVALTQFLFVFSSSTIDVPVQWCTTKESFYQYKYLLVL